MNHLVEGAKLVQAIAPVANGANGDYIKLCKAAMCFVIVNMAQGNGAQPAITIEKATGDGAGNVPITVAVPIWANLDCSASDTLVKRTAAVAYTLDAGVHPKQVIFQIDPAELGEGFGWLRVVVAASNAANIVSAEYLLTDTRYKSSTPPSAIV